MDYRHGCTLAMERSAGSLGRPASPIGNLDGRRRHIVAGDDANPFRPAGNTAA